MPELARIGLPRAIARPPHRGLKFVQDWDTTARVIADAVRVLATKREEDVAPKQNRALGITTTLLWDVSWRSARFWRPNFFGGQEALVERVIRCECPLRGGIDWPVFASSSMRFRVTNRHRNPDTLNEDVVNHGRIQSHTHLLRDCVVELRRRAVGLH